MIGKTLGHYRVAEQLGRGGMGEVYLADDLNLNRKVALKFLPDAFAADPERMARFEREAKLLASLNHPNIAAIYGLEQAEGKRFLVLELVEGETLAQRLSKGALSVEEALGVCRQIAEALEAAHDKGVIHRDLKPANVMITSGDKVKILDFGLAKALADETQSVDSSQSPTLTEAMTRPGVILGTAAYMSPEQAKGKAVDKRADIWAFSCILYECLTGKRLFEGDTVTETLAAVLTREPDWEKVPEKVRPLLLRCLERDPKKRLRDIGDAMPLLEIVPQFTPVKRPWLLMSVAGVFLIAFATLSFIHFREKPSVAEPMRLQIALPDKVNLGPGPSVALSPDGRHLAFVAAGSDGVLHIWLRALDSFESHPILEAAPDWPPFIIWSSDSHSIVFKSGGRFKKIDIFGGPPQTLTDILSGNALGGSMNSDGVIVFGRYGSGEGIVRLSATGDAAWPVTKPNPARKETNHCLPVFLPDGRHFLYFCRSDISENSGIYIGSPGVRPEEQNSKRLVASSSGPIYVPAKDSVPAHLLFLREHTLIAQPFDDRRLELIGLSIPLAEKVDYFLNAGTFSASTNGVLIYMSGSGLFSQPTWFDRQGKVLGLEGEKGSYMALAISPNGTRVAMDYVNTAQRFSSFDIWLRDLSKGTNTRFTFGKGISGSAVWSPDESRIIFGSDRDGVFSIYQKLASGAKDEEMLLKTAETSFPASWSRDGRFLLYNELDPKTKYDLWVLPIEGDHKPTPFLRTEFNEIDGRFSPDMRWIAYVSDESGISEIYVRPFSQASSAASSEGSGKVMVSKGGGTGPRWRGDGKELYYRDPDGRVMAVDVTANAVFQAGTPKSLFQVPLLVQAGGVITHGWDVAPDGKRFLLAVPTTENSRAQFSVVLNWTALLKK